MMEIVINIPEELYEGYKGRPPMLGDIGMDMIAQSIANGTPLLKHHGRLIDENELIDEIVCEEIDGRYYDVVYAHSIYDAPTIIEADKEE